LIDCGKARRQQGRKARPRPRGQVAAQRPAARRHGHGHAPRPKTPKKEVNNNKNEVGCAGGRPWLELETLVNPVTGDRGGVAPQPSLRHFVTQGLLPSVFVLGCGFSMPVCGLVRTFD